MGTELHYRPEEGGMEPAIEDCRGVISRKIGETKGVVLFAPEPNGLGGPTKGSVSVRRLRTSADMQASG